jgi:hypothetical protein
VVKGTVSDSKPSIQILDWDYDSTPEIKIGSTVAVEPMNHKMSIFQQDKERAR